MDRKLASIRKISDIQPIEGADMIELVIVDGWKVVVAKNVGHKLGDLVIYCEIDSFLPIREEFEFLRKSSYKKMVDGTEGFRLRSIRLKNQLSQGLILPLSVLESGDEMIIGISEQPSGPQLQLGPYDNALVIEEGTDVTEMLGIVKYEPPIPAELAGKVKGLFPSFLRKTDEERIQNLTSEYEGWKNSDKRFYVTEKLDGSSATFYFKDGVFGVCSRNLELLESEGNTFWKVARQLDLENKMRDFGLNISIQGELIGSNVNGNIYKLNYHDVKFFNVFDIDNQEYYGLDMYKVVCDRLGVETVPVLDEKFKLPSNIDVLLLQAEGKSVINENTDREGLVIRSLDMKISFKVISNKFLLKNE